MAADRREQEGGGVIFKQWRFETDCQTPGQHHRIESFADPLVCARCGAAATEIVEAVQAHDVRDPRQMRPPRGESRPL